MWVFYLIAVAAGLSNPVQSAINATLNKGLGQPLVSAFVIYGVALSTLVVGSLVYGLSTKGLGGRFGEVPWWAFTGGVCNLVFVLASAIATRAIGSGAFTVVVTTFAITLSVVLDRFGLLGLEVHALSWQRVLGALLAIAGAVLVSAF